MDFRIAPALALDSPAFKAFHADIAADYADAKEKRVEATNIQFSGKEPPRVLQAPSQLGGYLYSNPKQGCLAQFDRDGFTFNKLKPYECWEIFIAEAQRLWRTLIKHLPAETRIRRVGLRYVNRLELPLPFKSFDEFMLTSVHLPAAAKLSMSDYLLRMVVPNRDLACVGIIHQRTLPPVAGRLPLIFDIDIVKETGVPLEDPELWATIQAMKDFENHIFFNSLTEKTERLYR